MKDSERSMIENEICRILMSTFQCSVIIGRGGTSWEKDMLIRMTGGPSIDEWSWQLSEMDFEEFAEYFGTAKFVNKLYSVAFDLFKHMYLRCGANAMANAMMRPRFENLEDEKRSYEKMLAEALMLKKTGK